MRRFSWELELRSGLFGGPSLRAHTTEKLPNRQPPTLERQLPPPRVWTKDKIRVIQLRSQRTSQFRNGVGVLVLSGDHGKLVAVPDLIGNVLDDVEDAAGRFGVPAASHALAESMQEPLVLGRELDLEPVP
jgi:hypothetical protein